MTVEQMAMRANQVTDEVDTQEPPPPDLPAVQKWRFPTVYSGFSDLIELLIEEVQMGLQRCAHLLRRHQHH